MKEITLGKGSDAIIVKVRKSFRAKSIGIRIKTINVELIVPAKASFNQAHKFLLEKELWIRNKLRGLKLVDKLPETISILGSSYHIIQDVKTINKPIEITNNKIMISHIVASLDIKWFIIKELKKIAKLRIEKFAFTYAKKLNVQYKKITIRDTTSRWGSCSTAGNLSFSWRLIFAPIYVLEYVVIHEICHLIEMNHSKKFWQLVANLCPEYSNSVSWLKINGKKLHMLL